MRVLADPLYADTSALVKLVVAEPESQTLAAHIKSAGYQLTSSELTEIELVRAVARSRESLSDAESLLQGMVLLPLTSAVRRRAANLTPPELRSLDAIHLASALEVKGDLASLVTYDDRMLSAARTFGLKAVSPGA